MAAINIYSKPINQIPQCLSRRKFSELVQKIRFEVLSEALDTHPVLLSQCQQATDSRDRAKEKDAAGAEIVLIHRRLGINYRQTENVSSSREGIYT